MRLARSLSLALLALLALISHSQAADTRAFVLTTDYSSGGLRAVDLATRTVLSGEASVFSDATLRWYGGLIYVVNRFGQDNIQVVNPATLATVRQFSTGNGSNPQDIAFVSATKAYVSRYASSDLLIVNPSTGASLGVISLAAFADADGLPEMARMIRVDNRLFVALQRLYNFLPTDSSLVAVIDTDADTLLDANPALPGKQAIRLTGLDPVTTFAFDRATSRLLIGCVGRFGVLDGGIEWIDPVAMKSLGYAVTEAALGGDISSLVWNGPGHSYAIVSDPSYNASLVSWSALSGTRLGTIWSPGGFNLADLALDDRGQLWVCDNSFTSPGLMVWRAGPDTLLAGPLDTGLPPVQIVFDQATDAVTAVGPALSTLAFSTPTPNPAHAVTRFVLTLPRTADVEVEVFDATGRRVRRLAEGPRAAGRLELAWDLRDDSGALLGPGLYLIRARLDGGEIAVRRVALLR